MNQKTAVLPCARPQQLLPKFWQQQNPVAYMQELSKILESNGLVITEHRYYNRFFERFASEMNTILLRRAGGLEELKEASAAGSISNACSSSDFSATFCSFQTGLNYLSNDKEKLYSSESQKTEDNEEAMR